MSEVLLPGARYVRRRTAVIIGAGLVVVIIGVGVLVVATFKGAFTNYATITAQLPYGANAPQLQSAVEYRNVTVGEVASEGKPIGGGRVEVTIHVKPSMLKAVPATVDATVGPLTIFGTQFVDLQAVHGTGGAGLRAGQVIPALPNAPSASLQNTTANFYNLLKEIQPAQLDATLSALATGLQGQGKRLGVSLVLAEKYLHQTLPLLPVLEKDIGLIGPVAQNLAGSARPLLNLIANASVTAKTVVENENSLNTLLKSGASASGTFATMLDNTKTPFENLLLYSAPLLNDINANNPKEFSEVLSGLDTWATSWTAAESSGPYLKLSTTVNVKNPADVVLGGVGAPNLTGLFAAGLGAKYANPATYTSSDCPTYQGVSGNCSPGVTDTTTGLTSATAKASTLAGLTSEEAAAAQVTSGLNKGGSSGSAAADVVWLSPILDSGVSG